MTLPQLHSTLQGLESIDSLYLRQPTGLITSVFGHCRKVTLPEFIALLMIQATWWTGEEIVS